MKRKNIICSLALAILCGCSLDYENSGTITPDNVWKDKTMISSFTAECCRDGLLVPTIRMRG